MVQYPAYNKVFGVATHNSYWINRSDGADFGASGTQELISDQLLHDHVRALEIDIHCEGSAPGQWKVYHTSDSEDFLGRYLEDYLDYLRNFHYALPQHDVINVIIELKNVDPPGGLIDVFTPVHYNFDANHTIEQFDETFRRYLGPWLYTPGDFLARSPGATTMVECVQAAGWPTIDELRGKFIVNVLGNYSTAAYDWVSYAMSNLTSRVAFPMQSVFAVVAGTLQGFPGGLPPTWFKATAYGSDFFIKDIADDWYAPPSPAIDPAARQAAFDASIFWQFEPVQNLPANSFGLDRAKDFLANGGVIRCTDSFDYPDQLDRLVRGFQMVQTDYPWHVVNDQAPGALGIPTDPSRRLRDGSWLSGPPGIVSGAFHEPGTRFYGHTTPPAEIWAYANVPAVSQRWLETTISTTRNGDTAGLSYPRRAQDVGVGSIRGQSEDGLDSVVLVRHKETQPGASYYQEKVIVTVIVFSGGQRIASMDFDAARYGPCRRDDDPNSSDVSSVCVGSLIGLAVENDGDGATVTGFSAGRTAADGTPDWQRLGQWRVSQALTRQGFSSSGDVLFVGPRTAENLNSWNLPAVPPDFVSFADLTERQVFTASPNNTSVFVDLTQPYAPCPSAKIVVAKRSVTTRCIVAPPLVNDEDVTLSVQIDTADLSTRPDFPNRVQTIQWSVVGADVLSPANQMKISLKVGSDVKTMAATVTLTDNLGCTSARQVVFQVNSLETLSQMDALCQLLSRMREIIRRLPIALQHPAGPDPGPESAFEKLRRVYQKQISELAQLAKQYEADAVKFAHIAPGAKLSTATMLTENERIQLQLMTRANFFK